MCENQAEVDGRVGFPAAARGIDAGRRTPVAVPTVGVTLSPAETRFALQPGLGVNLMVTEKIGVQVATDYRRADLGENRGDKNESRFTIGIVVPLGSRSSAKWVAHPEAWK